MGLFLSQGCAVCDRPTAHTFCLDCQRQVFQPVAAQNQSDPLPVVALGLYDSSLKRAILAMKYGDRPDVAWPLGTALGRYWLAQQPRASQHQTTKAAGRSTLYALPIPLHAGRQKSRGFNQAELIARSFCQVSKVPLLADGLVRVQATRPQHELGLAERQQNLEQVFQVGKSLRQRAHRAQAQGKASPSVLLVDDIYTTGATVQSAAATLRQAGISVKGIVTVARAAL